MPNGSIVDPTTKEVLCFADGGHRRREHHLVGYMRALVCAGCHGRVGGSLLPRLLEIDISFNPNEKLTTSTAHHLKFGTTSSVQGNGLGARLLKVGIDRATRAKVHATSNPQTPATFRPIKALSSSEASAPLAQPRFHIEGPLVTLMVRDMEEGRIVGTITEGEDKEEG